MAATYTAIILITSFGLCAAANEICPANWATNIRRPFGAANYVQQGLWHQIPCPTFREGELIDRVSWFKRDSPTTTSRLISRTGNTDNPVNSRYAFGTSGFSLVIKGVDKSDQGIYLCQVIPRDTTERTGDVDIQVIGDKFPGGNSQVSSTASFERGRRQTLTCECAEQMPDVVYWSTGEGANTDTQIIGARFSDSATLQVQHGADYSIASDASLAVNSLNDVQDSQRFWCHVFQSDGNLRNCDTNVQISDEMESTSDLLKVSERSFYLRKDKEQTLPCPAWTPGDTACGIEWIKLDNPNRQVFSYNLSTGVVDSSLEFDLASDFGLEFQSVDDDHVGVYRCAVGDTNQKDVEVRVIGDRFPLDNGIAIKGDSVIFEPQSKFSLRCPALADISLTTKATLFWSFGGPDVKSTTVVGTLKLPDGHKTLMDLGDNSCLGISIEGALLFDNCSLDGDVRYWCHVFPANNDLIRSHVDVSIANFNGDPGTFNVVAIAVCVPLFLVLLGSFFFVIRKRRQSRRYEPLCKQESVPELNLKTLSTKVKTFVISKLGRISITPWVDRDDACFASIDTVYKPLEMYANVPHGDTTVKYRLVSESGIFDDGFPEFTSKHALIQGRGGCGKTTFLHKVIYDWAMGREGALFGSDQMVFLLPAWLLIKAKTIGRSVVECMLPKDANISTESIDAHFARDKSNLTILVDDCNDQDDIDTVMKLMTDNEFLGCQLVLATRNAELAKVASRDHNMRHVTITGFTLTNAIEYIDLVLNAADERQKSTPEHKAIKSEAELKLGSTSDTNIKQHLPAAEEFQKVLTPSKMEESTTTEKLEALEAPTRKKKRNFPRYLLEDILQPDISCLPAVLGALCQMSIWTKGDAFKPDVTMTNLFFRLIKFMFDRIEGLEVSVTEGNQLGLLKKDQLDVLAKLGRVAYSRRVDSGNYAAFLNDDFLSSSEKEDDILEDVIKLGLLRRLQSDSRVESTQQSTTISEVSEVEIRRVFLCCKGKQQRGTDPDPTRQDTELTPLTSPKIERVCFVLEIFEQLCTAVFLAQTAGGVKQWEKDIANMGHKEILQRFSNVFQFAIQDEQFDREALVDYFVKIISRGYSQDRPLHVVLKLQEFVELCLQLNFKGQWKGALNKKLKSIFPDEMIRLIGISSRKLRLLSYLLEHAQPIEPKLKVKSVHLLRIGDYDWSELEEYIVHFISGKKRPEKKKQMETKTADSRPAATETHRETVPRSQEDTKEPPELQPGKSEDDDRKQEADTVKSSKTEPQADPIKEARQTTTIDSESEMATSYIGRVSPTGQSQSNSQQHSVPHQQTTAAGTDSSPPDVNADNENISSPNPQIGPGDAPETLHQTDPRFSPDPNIPQSDAAHPSAFKEPHSDHAVGETKSGDLSLPETGLVDSPTDEYDGTIDESKMSVDRDIEPFEVIDGSKELAVLKKLRERIVSGNKDMPKFSPEASDGSVLHTIQSFCLQELLEAQAGECHLSGAASDLACYLPCLETLESLVLVGTILSSEAICDLAKNAYKLKNLKTLDLRLNRQFDDRAFVAVTNKPLRECRKLTNLRLSLYKVTSTGFDEVQRMMTEGGEDSWGRLKTLCLLHGSPPETFVRFLSNSLKYFHSVDFLHFSASHQIKSDEIQRSIQEEFEKNLDDPKIMPNVTHIVIGNMDTLMVRLASSKPQKTKTTGQKILKQFRKVVKKKKASEVLAKPLNFEWRYY